MISPEGVKQGDMGELETNIAISTQKLSIQFVNRSSYCLFMYVTNNFGLVAWVTAPSWKCWLLNGPQMNMLKQANYMTCCFCRLT
mmetsp:Transcript_2683/g.4780  ORF Transcript_2683/g.4780 Transcript_2683/m.4780 type:complete len:85 (+) Transcript_2683:556-810(+)